MYYINNEFEVVSFVFLSFQTRVLSPIKRQVYLIILCVIYTTLGSFRPKLLSGFRWKLIEAVYTRSCPVGLILVPIGSIKHTFYMKLKSMFTDFLKKRGDYHAKIGTQHKTTSLTIYDICFRHLSMWYIFYKKKKADAYATCNMTSFATLHSYLQ
jgi:hypothetical protein